MANLKEVLITLVLEVQDLVNASSSDSDEEEVVILQHIANKKRKVARVPNYVETIVPVLRSEDFKAHFRYQLCK